VGGGFSTKSRILRELLAAGERKIEGQGKKGTYGRGIEEGRFLLPPGCLGWSKGGSGNSEGKKNQPKRAMDGRKSERRTEK